MKMLAHKLVNKLVKKKLKLTVAESCTGGLFSSIITSIAGSSKTFDLGLITYSNQSKVKILKIPKKIIKKYGAVSSQICIYMVKNLSKITGSNISLSITGIAGPSGGTRNKPVGLVYISVKMANKIITSKCLFKNKGRHFIQRAAVNKSLKLILGILK